MSPKVHKSTRKPMVHIHVRVDQDLVTWIDARIEEMTYKDRSHAVNFALKFLKDNTFKADEIIPVTKEAWEAAERNVPK